MDTGNDPSENKLLAGSDDYLWDRSGEPDPEIQRLEAMLGKFQSNRPRPVLPGKATASKWSFFQRLRLVPLLSSVLALATIGFVIYAVNGKKTVKVEVAGWDVAWMAGTPRVGPIIIRGKEGGRLGVGQTLETDPHSRATLRADEIGQIEVDSNTRLRLLTMGSGLKRIALDRGTIRTYIWASPGEFVVDTPSATTVDLGCAYTLQVDDSGAGTVRTSMGWVGFTLNGREAFIPAGAACATRPNVGPGTPYFEDASDKFREALAKFDFEKSTPQERAQELAKILGEARKRDALTLWHLLARVDPGQRRLVYDRLRKLSPPPRNTTMEGILSLDRTMLDLWWNQLGFDDISIWRHWERTWAASPAPAPQK